MPRVVPINEIYKGKTYSQWISEWCNWFYMTYPDQYNNEPYNDVKFLRSFPSPDKIASFQQGQTIQYEGSPIYRNVPNVMVGNDKVVMYDDQAIFFPVMNAMFINTSPNADFGYMERWVKQQNSNSNDPPMPYQFTIDGDALIGNPLKIAQYKIDTGGLFDLRVPDADYGTSLKDFVMSPVSPGWYQAYCQGYYFMVDRFEPRDESYFIFAIAKGTPYSAGEYYAALTYEIKVIPKELRSIAPQSGDFPDQIIDKIKNEIRNKINSEEINSSSNRFIGFVEKCRDAHKSFIESSYNNRKKLDLRYGEIKDSIDQIKDQKN